MDCSCSKSPAERSSLAWGACPSSRGKGKGVGKGKKGSKSKGDEGRLPLWQPEFSKGGDRGHRLGRGKGRSEKGDWPPVNGAKTVAEQAKRNADSGCKQRVEGSHCQVEMSGKTRAMVSLHEEAMRVAIMGYAEKSFRRSVTGNLEMYISHVKVQLMNHKDARVSTKIFVVWGRQQEKGSPLTVGEIADCFDKLYEDAMNAPAGAPGPAVSAGAVMLGGGPRPPPPPPPEMAHHTPHQPAKGNLHKNHKRSQVSQENKDRKSKQRKAGGR